jgi:hypothetical protein
MSLSDSPWVYYVLQSPYFLALLVAGIMCISNYGRNPRGATLLGLAVVLNLAASGMWFLFSFGFSNSLYTSTNFDPQTVLYGMSFVSAMMHAGSWILAALAVFSRSRHEATDFFHSEG